MARRGCREEIDEHLSIFLLEPNLRLRPFGFLKTIEDSAGVHSSRLSKDESSATLVAPAGKTDSFVGVRFRASIAECKLDVRLRTESITNPTGIGFYR